MGVLTLKDGTKLIGEFKQGIISEGTVKFLNGNLYKGGIKNNDLHGKGVVIFADGARYEGDFAEGRQNGIGS